MTTATAVQIGICTVTLIVGVIDDIRSRKVHNTIVIFFALVGLASSFLLGGVEGLKQGLYASGIAFAICIPLVMARVLGAGDMKLMMAFGLNTDFMTVFWVLVYSLIWGALLGLFRAIIQGDILTLLKNTASVATFKKPNPSQLHPIPYTVALLFGWLTQLSLIGALWGGLW